MIKMKNLEIYNLFKKQRRLPMIFQDEITDCGYACTVMLANFYGHQIDLLSLRKRQPSHTGGMTLLALMELLESLQFNTYPLRLNTNELKNIPLPAILHWENNHFIVLKSIKKRQIVIHNPQSGIEYLSHSEFLKKFTGVALEIEPKLDFTPLRDQQKLTLKHFFKCMTGQRQFLIIVFILSFCIECLSLMQPQFLQFASDYFINTIKTVRALMLPAFAFSLLALLLTLTEVLRSYLMIHVTTHITEQFSSNLTQHLLKLPIDFFEKRHRGDLQSKCQSIHHIQKKIGSDFISSMIDGIMLIFQIGIMLYYSVPLTVCVLLLFGFNLALRQTFFYKQKYALEISLQQHAKTATYFLENLTQIISIKAYAREKNCFLRWRQTFIHALNADIHLSKWQALQNAIWHFLMLIERIMIVTGGVLLISHHKFTLGMLIAFLAYREIFETKGNTLAQNFFEYQLIKVYLSRLQDLFQTSKEISSSPYVQKPILQGKVTIKNLSFRYHANDAFLFKNLNLTLHAHETVILKGPSGCGKSTLLKLILGLLTPQTGSIFIDDHPLTTWDLQHYRRQVGNILSEPSFINGTILENITYFNEKIDISYARHVSKKMCLEDVISSLPMGYDTMLNDLCPILSSGEKQRLLLARALYQKPKILLLDEATSHLDNALENHIQETLAKEKMTQIIITHRPDIIQSKHRVIDLSFLGKNSTNLAENTHGMAIFSESIHTEETVL